MKFSIFILLALLSACASRPTDKKITTAPLPTEKVPDLLTIAEFRGAQATGVTVASDGRMFATFPRWRDNLPFSLVEVMKDGSSRPYPNEAWNKWKGHPEKNKFTCAQAVQAVGNSLFVLDPSSPKMEGVQGNAKLYEFDMNTNGLIRTFTFDKKVAPKKAYLNDFRVDEEAHKVYITDSGQGGLVILDTITGNARRVLDEHPSTHAENVTLLVNGRAFVMRGDRKSVV